MQKYQLAQMNIAIAEGKEKLFYLREHGSTEFAFTFAQSFSHPEC